MNYEIKLKTLPIFISVILILPLSSCSKKENDKETNKVTAENNEQLIVRQDDFNESNEDLFTIDYKEFYNELSSQGEWIKIYDKDLGLNIQRESGLRDSDIQKQLTYLIAGVKDAYALDESEAFFVWKPSADLAVSIATEPTSQYVPYTNGQWIYTDAGWYFKAPTTAEEITSHYGRWLVLPELGWTWVPGRVWAPAWVDWRENEDYLAWAPIPPAIYITNSVLPAPAIDEDRYVIVEKKYFVEPDVYKYMYKENKNKIMIKEMSKINGVMIMNKTVINKGPAHSTIAKVGNRNFEIIKINKVKNRNDVKFTGKEINIFTPEFRKIKIKEKFQIAGPPKFINYKDLQKSNGENAGKEERKSDDNDSENGDDKKDKEWKDRSGKSDKDKDKTEKEFKRNDKDNNNEKEIKKKNNKKPDNGGDIKDEEKQKSNEKISKKDKK